MQHKPIPPVVLAAALSACSFQPESLNSERIEQRFGNYDVDVLEQNSGIRRSNVYSTDKGVRTCRTYAVVKFMDPGLAEIAAVHEAVLGGRSIGATFKDAGWEIRKMTTYIGSAQVGDPQHTIARIMRLNTPADVGLHAYQLSIEKGARSIHYATIVESHHPAYLTETELADIYPLESEFRADAEDVKSLIHLLLDTD
ncbi:MAG: hypothetical protein OEQ14_18065 [Gammaproteobacteria bacterium]|nr:hypothetical protein [Gammaproteobacteria bacterium]